MRGINEDELTVGDQGKDLFHHPLRPASARAWPQLGQRPRVLHEVGSRSSRPHSHRSRISSQRRKRSSRWSSKISLSALEELRGRYPGAGSERYRARSEACVLPGRGGESGQGKHGARPEGRTGETTSRGHLFPEGKDRRRRRMRRGIGPGASPPRRRRREEQEAGRVFRGRFGRRAPDETSYGALRPIG